MVIYNEPIFYLIILTSELNLVDFSKLLNTLQGVRYSVDGTKALIKWKDSQPDFVSNFSYTDGPYNNSQILEIMATPEWSPPEDN
jgi:hypothetical protein